MATAFSPIGEEAQRSRASEKTLRVLTLTPFYPSGEDPAAGCFVEEPLALLAELGVKHTVVAVRPIHSSRRTPCRDAVAADWRRFPSLPGNAGLASAGEFLFRTIAGRYDKLHREKPFDLIHAHGALPCGYAAARLSRRLQIPFVVTVHGLDAFSSRQVRRPMGRWCERNSLWVYQSAARVICVSEKVQSEVLRPSSGIRTAVVYNGVDAARFSPATDSEPSNFVLSVGNLIPAKGHEILLRAFALIAHRFPDLRCRIIGEGPQRLPLQRLAMQLRITKRVQFMGVQSRSQVADAMRRCLFFALPSRYEALGCVYLEAMASAKAAIACSGQGIEEILRDAENGVLVRPDDAVETAEAMNCLAANEPLRKQLGFAARQTILRTFTTLHQAERLTTVYGECKP